MKNTNWILVLPSVLMMACSNNAAQKEAAPEYALADSAAAEPTVPGSKVDDTKYDRGRTVARKADIRFKTQNVYQATMGIEDASVRFGGYVSVSNLRSETEDSRLKVINDDSALQVERILITNELVVHVPHRSLDSFWKSVAPYVQILDHRNIQAITIRKAGDKRPVPETDGEVFSDPTGSANLQISPASHDDLITYARVVVSVYQNPVLVKSIVPNVHDLDRYKPGFGQRLWEGVKNGAQLIGDFMIWLSGIWPVAIILTLTGIWIAKRNKRSVFLKKNTAMS